MNTPALSKVLIVLLAALLSCRSAVENYTGSSSGCGCAKVTGKDIRLSVANYFSRQHKNYFNDRLNECYFKSYINNEIDSVKNYPFFAFDSNLVYHDNFDILAFSYAVLKKRCSDSVYFYGHFDVDQLMFPASSDRGRIIEFDNAPLNELLNVFWHPNQYSRDEFLNTFLTNLYFTNSPFTPNAKSPIFSRLNYQTFAHEYKTDKNADEFDKLFPKKDRDTMFIFVNRYYGAIVFKDESSPTGPLNVQEFLWPAMEGVYVARNDGTPEYLKDCQ